MFERCLYFNINNLARKVNKIWQQAFQELGLSPAHAYLLRLVLFQPDISQTEIAKELNLEKSTVTRFIDVLENKGYLKRHKVGREQLISPTNLAKKIEKQLNNKGDELYQQMIQNLGKNELKDFVKQLRLTNEKLN